jgi:hypothetical protein
MEHIQFWEISPRKYEIHISGTKVFLLEKWGMGPRESWILHLVVPGEMGIMFQKFKSKEEAFAFFERP